MTVYDDSGHWEICQDCGSMLQRKSLHTANCKSQDICSVCRAENVTISEINHSLMNSALQHNNEIHWTECEDCGFREYAVHKSYCDEPDRCIDCGAINVNISNVSHQDGILIDVTEQGHLYECTGCGEVHSSSHMLSCTKEKSTCLICGIEVDNGLWYDHGLPVLTGEAEKNGHWCRCDECGAVYLEPHKSICTDPETCVLCGGFGEGYTFTVQHISYSNQDGELICMACRESHKHEFNCSSGDVCSKCGIRVSDVDGATIKHCGIDYATYVIEAKGHERICRACGESTEPEPHSFTHGVCSICEYESANIEDLFTWSNTNGQAVITGFYGKTTSLAIPDELGGLVVTTIGNQAFMNNEKLANVILPENVRTINAYAFRGCKALHTIRLPDHLELIGNYAFYDCTDLTEVFIPLSVSEIANQAFSKSGLSQVTCYYSSYAHQWAAEKKYNLVIIPLFTEKETMLLPASLFQIDTEAFRACGAKRIIVQSGCACIEQMAFAYCPELEVIELPGTITNIENNAFLGSEGVMIIAPEESYVSHWATRNGIQFIPR